MQVLLRPARDSDLSFICHSWKKSLREYSPTLGNDAYYTLANAVCESVLSANPIVLVANPLPQGEGAPSESGGGSVIVGWVCAEATPEALVLWMGYSKSWARRQGVFTKLLHAATALAEEEGAGPARFFACPTRHAPHLEARGWKRTSAAKALHLRGSSKSSTNKECEAQYRMTTPP